MDTRSETIATLSAAEVADLERLSAILRALADEKRLKMLYLLTGGELCVCEIMEALDIAQALASHHLGVLRDAGLVRDRRDARWVYYSLNAPALAELERLMARLASPAPRPGERPRSPRCQSPNPEASDDEQ